MISSNGRESAARRWVWAGGILGLTVLAAALTYLAGGTKTPIPHAFYLPVVVAAGAFGVRGGLGGAILAGIACGPLMPLDVAAGQPQPTSGWLIRLGFFLSVGLVVGLGRNRLIELSRARQDFLSVVSHELRTPLAAVVGFASLLNDRADRVADPESREFAELILKEASELSNVVDHYVVEGRLKDEALFIDSRATDLRRIVEIVLEGIPVDVRQRVDVDGSDVICRADPLRLRQIMRSMVNNALAYTPNGLRIAITADKSYGEVAITDGDGPGAKLGLTRLNPLSGIASRPTPTLATPLGIGLAVSRDLARRMGGNLYYEVSESTEFKLRLPLHKRGSR